MQIEIWPLVIAVFTASVLGSMHCAGMCGAFLAIAVTQGERAVSPALLQLAYHGGRLLTYSALGAVAGLLGSAVDLAGEAAGIGRIAAVGAGVMMVGFGAIAIMRHYGIRIASARVPRVLQTAVAHGHRMVMNKPPLVRAASIGLLTTLLPCGWLYAFAITAAGTGRADTGAITMAVFWVGTLPILVTLGMGLSRASGLLKRRMPLATSLALIAIGAFTAMDRLAVPAMATHGKADASIERLSTLADETPPCCAGPGADEDDQSAVGEKP